jgi:archaellum biogenesis protein FlaJ (TadC family)
MQWNVLSKLEKLKIWNWNFTTKGLDKTPSNLDPLTTADDSKSLYEGNMENTKDKLTFYVTFMVSITLCISVLAMVGAFILGLWAKEVDNAEIFKMISPAFSTLIGGMIGFLSGIKLMQNEDDKK